MSHHDLKIWSVYFDKVKQGKKKAEVRKADRDYQLGDTVLLKEFLPNLNKFTGETQLVRIIDISDLSGVGIPGFVLFSFDKLADAR